MKDILKDIIEHTYSLNFIDLIKIAGTDKETVITAVAETNTVVVTGKLKNPHPEFIGTFGMPNLGKLKTILGFDDYDDHAKINVNRVNRDGVETPALIHFETKNGDFVNDYRLMAKAIVDEKVKTVVFKGVTWNVDFEPSIASIMRFQKQASANNEENTFVTKLEDRNLKIFFGDQGSHNGNFVFESDIDSKMTKTWRWPVKEVASILNLPGDKRYRISDQGATEITVDSGLAVYSYLLPAQTK